MSEGARYAEIGMSTRTLRTLAIVLAALVLVGHQSARAGWFIDDAAIGFAYARNLAEGHGLVPWPGGERVEAYSHPTWVGILALAYLGGVDGFSFAEPFSVLCGLITLPFVVDLTRRALPEHQGPAPVIAAVLLATSAPYAIWAASGLENAWFGLCLTIAVHRSALEAERGGVPWSALWYVVVTWTRPEGALYAVVGGGVAMLGTRREPWRMLQFWALWAVPSAVLEMTRLAYFAWPLPNSAYAKAVAPWTWLDGRSDGWSQLGRYLSRSGQGFVVPLYALGLVRSRSARLAALAIGAALFAWPGPERLRRASWWPDLGEPPDAFVLLRVLFVMMVVFFAPLAARGGPGEAVRTRVAGAIAAALAFWVGADGDWMGGFRFASFVAPLACVGLAVGLAELGDAIAARFGRVAWGPEETWVATGIVGLLGVAGFNLTRDHRTANFNVTTEMTAHRVAHLRDVAARLRWDGPVVVADMDAGGYLWHAPDFELVDFAMLVDVPMARHRSDDPSFLHPYVFEERRPDAVHLHGPNWSWSRRTQLMTDARWATTYVQLRPYPDVPGVPHDPHPGLWLRRDRLFGPDPDPDYARGLAPGWTLEAALRVDPPGPGARVNTAGIALPLRRDPGAGPLRLTVSWQTADGESEAVRWSTDDALIDPSVWPPDAVSRAHLWQPASSAPDLVHLTLSVVDGPTLTFDTTLAPHFHTTVPPASDAVVPDVDGWLTTARAAEARGDREAAFRGYARVLRAEPWRAWVRRAAERVRPIGVP